MKTIRTIYSLSALALFTLSLGIQPVYAGDDLVFVAVDPPCRIVDTRATGTPAIPADGTADFLGYGDAGELDSQGGDAGGCPNPRPGSIPVAISANVVAVGGQATGNGNLVAYSFGGSVPDTSLVNYKVGTNIANSSIIGLCQGTCANDFTLKSNFSAVPATVDLQGFLYPKTLQNVITVSAANGDFTDLEDALNSIPTTGPAMPTGDNRYVIEVGPGLYLMTRGAVPMRDYVSVIGSGVEATTIRGTAGGGFFRLDGVTGMELAHMTIIEDAQGGTSASAIFIETQDAVTSDPHLHDLKVIGENATTNINGILIDDDNSTGVLAPLIERVEAIAQNGGGIGTGINIQTCDNTRLERVNSFGEDRGLTLGADGDCAKPILWSQFSGPDEVDVFANGNANATLGHSHLVNGTSTVNTGAGVITCVAVTTPNATLDSDCTDPP